MPSHQTENREGGIGEGGRSERRLGWDLRGKERNNRYGAMNSIEKRKGEGRYMGDRDGRWEKEGKV